MAYAVIVHGELHTAIQHATVSRRICLIYLHTGSEPGSHCCRSLPCTRSTAGNAENQGWLQVTATRLLPAIAVRVDEGLLVSQSESAVVLR